MKFFFEPQSIAVVGASRDPQKDGYVILQNIIDSFSGSIFPVNPNANEILGLKTYSSLLEIPYQVDLVIIIVPAAFVPTVMEDCAKKQVKGVIIESMGFAEVGPEGEKLQNKVVEIARRSGIRVIGPNCTGIVSKEIVTSFFRIKNVPNGNVTLIGQSGLLAAGMASDIVTNRTLEIRKFCSIGNKCDVDENDLLEYFGDDPATRVISIYLESFHEGQRFLEIARRVASKKPIIVLYGGRSEAGARAAKSHTASIASNARVVDAVLKQTKCIKADDFSDLIEFARVFSTQPVPHGNRVAVLTAAGSVGVVVSDLCEEHGLKISPLSSYTIDRLKLIFPEWLKPTNPVDLWFTIEKLGYTRALTESMDAVFADYNIDCLLLVIAGFAYSAEIVENKIIQQIAKRYGKPAIVCTVVGDKKYKDLIQEKLAMEIPVFSTLSGGVRALSKLCYYGAQMKKGDDVFFS